MNLIQSCEIRGLCIFRNVIAKKRVLGNQTLIIHPDVVGSLGDEAMLAAVLQEDPEKKKYIICTVGKQNFPGYETINILQGNPVAFIGSIMHFSNALKKCNNAILFGADMIDGCYGEEKSLIRLLLISIAQKVIGKSSIVSFSLNKKIPQIVEDELRHIKSNCYPREKETAQRLEKLGVHNIYSSMDVSYLLKPENNGKTKQIIAAIQKKATKENTSSVIGINPNELSFGKNNEPKAISYYCKIIEELSNDTVKRLFVFIPHDYRIGSNDLDLSKKIVHALPLTVQERCVIIEEKVTAAEMRAIIVCCDIVFTGRLHLSISCLHQGIPPIALERQDKFKGIFDYFNISDLLLTPKEISSPDLVAKKINAVHVSRKKCSAIILKKKASTINLLKKDLIKILR